MKCARCPGAVRIDQGEVLCPLSHKWRPWMLDCMYDLQQLEELRERLERIIEWREGEQA